MIDEPGHDVIETRPLDNRGRYQLLTTLVVPRPIAWVSTYAEHGALNLAPFSYFSVLAATPMLVGVSIGHRPQGPKDTLANIRVSGAFCINVVTERHLEAMNLTSGEYPPDVDEFALAGLEPRAADHVHAPYVADCPAVLECQLHKEVALEGARNTLVIGEVMAVRLGPGIELEEGTRFVKPLSLPAIGRLGSLDYVLPGSIVRLSRPPAPGASGG